MSSSRSSQRHVGKNSSKFKDVKPFDLFYQLTYLSAMASAGITRSKTFEIAAKSPSPVALYFVAINTLADEFRRVRNDGRFAGFILYETNSFMRTQRGGGCDISIPVVNTLKEQL